MVQIREVLGVLPSQPLTSDTQLCKKHVKCYTTKDIDQRKRKERATTMLHGYRYDRTQYGQGNMGRTTSLACPPDYCILVCRVMSNAHQT